MPDEQPIQIGDLHLDPVSQRVKVNDQSIDLPPTEFRLLHYFMGHPDRVFTRGQLLDQAWGTQVYVEERTVDVHIRRLRKNLEPYNLDTLIQTVHGRGYRFSKQI
jgi:two-component system phosphate regulon response regulator PhoB